MAEDSFFLSILTDILKEIREGAVRTAGTRESFCHYIKRTGHMRNKDFNNIYLTGDTHGDFYELVTLTRSIGITDRDLLINPMKIVSPCGG